MHLDKRAITHAAPLPRQEQSPTTTTPTPTITNKPDSPDFTPSYSQVKHTKLPGWQIVLIVVGGLFFIGVLFSLFLIVRSHIRGKRAVNASNLHLAGRTGKARGSDNDHGLSSTGEVFDNMDIPDLTSNGYRDRNRGGAGAGGDRPKGKRESVLMEARVKMRKLIKPRRTSDSNGFTSILSLGLGKGGKKGSGLGSGKDLEDDADESKTMSPWSSNVTRKKSLVIHDNQTGSGLTGLAREQQEREGRHHQQLYSQPHSPWTGAHFSNQNQNQYSPHTSYSQYSRPYSNQNNRGSGNNSNGNSNSGRIHNDDNWMLSSDSVAHTIRESFDIVGSYQNDRLHNAGGERGGPGEDNYLESPPTTGLGHETIPLESRIGSNRNSGGFGFSGFKFGHDRRKPS